MQHKLVGLGPKVPKERHFSYLCHADLALFGPVVKLVVWVPIWWRAEK
jgi:hypothetical protein